MLCGHQHTILTQTVVFDISKPQKIEQIHLLKCNLKHFDSHRTDLNRTTALSHSIRLIETCHTFTIMKNIIKFIFERFRLVRKIDYAFDKLYPRT